MRIGIIGAMDVEIASLREQMKLGETVSAARMTFYRGILGETDIVLVKSGVGKVNAGVCVQLLADRFKVTHIINTGVAGSLRNSIDIGDIVVSVDAMYHDVDATVFGYQKGEIPQMGITAFPADIALRKAAMSAIREAAPEIRGHEGTILSGDQFISTRDKKSELMRDYDGLCAEMEGAAIAQAAWLNHIPYVILRAISDKADESVQESYDMFEGKAARHCADIVSHMVSNLPNICSAGGGTARCDQ